MQQFDRLTTLMQRFSLRVHPAPLTTATLVVTTSATGQADQLLFRALGTGFDVAPEQILMSASIDWGGTDNPLMAALSGTISLDLAEDTESRGLVTLICSELQVPRCGGESVVNRLCEVLIVRMMRRLIEAGTTESGLLAGLSDPRISRSIVAMHDQPGRQWRNEDLAQTAGLSLSRFTELFATLVGEPPTAYLRRWRLTLARQDIAKGDRIDAIARRYGYTSPDGFARAFSKYYGDNPIALRPRQVA